MLFPRLFPKMAGILFCLLFLLHKGEAQDFVIVHDLQKDTTNFYRVEKAKDTLMVNEISLKKPGRITLKVENFNPFYWAAKVTTKKIPSEDQTSYIGTFITRLTKFGGLPDLEIPGFGNAKGRPTEINQKYFYVASLYANIYNRISLLYKKPQEMKGLEMYLTELRSDPHKTEKQIKTEARKAVTRVIGKDSIDFEDVLTMGSDMDEKRAALEEKKEILLDSLAALKKELDQLELDPRLDLSYTVDTLNIKNVSTQIKITDRFIKSEKEKVSSSFSFLDELSQIRSLYSDIVNTSFQFLSSTHEKADISELILNVFPRSDSMAKGNAKDTISRYFPIKSKPSLRLRNSAGVTFSYFQDNNRSYFIKQDTTIGSGSADLFTPVISTFIHFFNYKPTGLKWSGSFGIGIPVAGTSRDINYMLGLSTILGRNELIFISAGIAGSKVDRLTKGWKVGQKVPEMNFAIPKLSQFRVGGFISITFNLKSLSSNKQQD